MGNHQLPDTSNWPQLGARQGNVYRVGDTLVDMRRVIPPVIAARIPALPQDLLIDVGRSALVIIDMQNDFCAPDGWMASMQADVSGAQALVDPINRTAAAMRSKGGMVVWLNWGVRPDRLNLSPGTLHPFNPNGKGPGLAGELAGPARSYRLLEKGGWGAAILDGLTQADGDIYVDKHRISGFWDTPLDSILRNLGIKTLLFAGVNADQCVLGTLMDANFHGYDTILLEDCAATTSPDFCFQATLHNVRFCFGFTATSTDLAAGLAAD